MVCDDDTCEDSDSEVSMFYHNLCKVAPYFLCRGIIAFSIRLKRPTQKGSGPVHSADSLGTQHGGRMVQSLPVHRFREC